MKIYQKNINNNFGFKRISEKDIGCDENGNIAYGYQHHDALWWENSPIKRNEATTTLTMQEAISSFDYIFEKLTYNIHTYIKPKNILDLGCGNGQLTQKLRKYGIITATVDANKDTIHSPYIDENHFIGRTDKELIFVDENNKQIKFDLVISLEHFEHVSEETFDTLMQNISNHTHENSYLIFTAANWKYDTEDKKHIHCNLKDKNEWIKYIEKFKFQNIEKLFNIDRGGNSHEIFAKKLIN